ncbi:MAG: glycosyltransferase [Pirellulales bacterium]|nr:glycosyltransferase [Pirellulales bacterium]
MRPRIKLGYADFWGGFSCEANYFSRLLAPYYDVELGDAPDFLLYSCFGKSFRRHRGVRIYYTGENTRPNFRQCDFAFTFDHIDRPEHYRLPLYAHYADPQSLVKGQIDAQRVLAAKTRFCNFVYSNPRCKTRNKFFHKLSKYKRVDAGGRLFNNIGGAVNNKIQFLQHYKFTIAFENDSYPGYTTEKLVEPMLAQSLPVYWGNPLVDLDFNPRSFVNFFDYGSLDDLVDRIVDIDRNDDLYCDYLRQPWYHGDEVNRYVRPENVIRQFARIFSQPVAPAAASRQSIFPWPIRRRPRRSAA